MAYFPLRSVLPSLLLAGAGFAGARLLRGSEAFAPAPPVLEHGAPPPDAGAGALEAQGPRLEGAPAAPAPRSAPRSAAAPPAAPATGPATGAAPPETLDPAPEPRILAALVAREEALLRAQAEARIANAEQAARWELAVALAGERDERDDLVRGGLFAQLREVQQGRGVRFDPEAEPQRFARAFEAQQAGGLVDPPRIRGDTLAADGDRLLLPAGRVSLPLQSWLQGLPAARDLVIEGAGMDETLLVLQGSLHARRDVFNLTLRDLTVLARGNELVTSQGGVGLRLDRCRVLGLEAGPLVRAPQAVVWATGLLVDAAFSPADARRGRGWLETGGALAAVLRDCTFSGPMAPLVDPGPSRNLVFERCVLSGLEPQRGPAWAAGAPGLVFRECTFSFAEPSSTEPEPRGSAAAAPPRALTDINPRWAEAPR